MTGDVSARRVSPLDDLSLSGSLMPALWGSVGVALLLTGLQVSHGRWLLVGLGGVTAVFGLVLRSLDWSRQPVWVVRPLPYAGAGILAVACGASAGAYDTVVAVCVVAMMWSGFALAPVDVALLTTIYSVVLLVARLHAPGSGAAVVAVLPVSLLLGVTGSVMQWLRHRMDVAAQTMVRLQQEAAEAQVESLERQRVAQAQRAAEAAEQLAAQTRLQDEAAERTMRLVAAAGLVSDNTQSAAADTGRIATALQDLTSSAAATERITADVRDQAEAAVAVIRALEASSSQIMAASDVIQGIAEQTNLLALNATIESARAGEAGRGFAVVAAEVKDLARQSGENADTITRTLAEVQGQVTAAVERVAGISGSMARLSEEHRLLAVRLEEQSGAVRQVSGAVESAAAEVVSMADGIRALDAVSRRG